MNKIIKIENKNFIKLNHAETRKLLPVIIENGIPLMRKKKDGTYSYIPSSDLDQYLKNLEIDLYIEDAVYNRYKSINIDFTFDSQTEQYHSGMEGAETELSDSFKTDSVFKAKLNASSEMDMMERVQSVMNSNYQLKALIENNSRFDSETASELADAFSRILCVSKAALQENVTKPVSEDKMIKLINETEFAVENLITLLSNGKSSYADLAKLEFIQTGSSTLNHMNRMLIRIVSFLFFYNEYFDKHSNDIKRIRGHFKEKFHGHYSKLFTDPQSINLEIVFKGGISPIDDKKTFLEYALGGFFHDIGKLPAIEYHDGDEGFVAIKARRHVFDTYNMLLQSGRFSLGLVAMGLLHHDYYNAPYGYRQRETLIKKFDKRKMDRSDSIRTKYCMSHNIKDVAYGIALSYFPGKVLEILDIYDAMTDPDKNYKQGCLNPYEALVEMKKQYIENKQPGIDPILFNIFVDFLKAGEVLNDSNTVDAFKV